jgi:hypothetical protein
VDPLTQQPVQPVEDLHPYLRQLAPQTDEPPHHFQALIVRGQFAQAAGRGAHRDTEADHLAAALRRDTASLRSWAIH